MKIFHANGSKERLFEMMKKVNRLNESLLSTEEKDEILDKLIEFVHERLDFKEEFPEVRLSYDEGVAQSIKSFGQYFPTKNEIVVVALNRNFGDTLRTVVHELIHYIQKIKGKLKQNSGETGSNEENEANALAGVIMREFGKNNPNIFE